LIAGATDYYAELIPVGMAGGGAQRDFPILEELAQHSSSIPQLCLIAASKPE
jgi:hypothetical protein